MYFLVIQGIIIAYPGNPHEQIIQGGPWAPDSYKWSYDPYKWLYKRVTGVRTLLIGVITPLITGRGPPCSVMDFVFFWPALLLLGFQHAVYIGVLPQPVKVARGR